ncbi:hypothetical protein MRB53_021330 [Persea americana]|uniref:Uncharacterized protein n=1 Tax=Persea americana TaxID=3435 RepID=A0ACC2L3T4_PERAE|nr:hypothetical protein MRB53_021330 [Persea americana]
MAGGGDDSGVLGVQRQQGAWEVRGERGAAVLCGVNEKRGRWVQRPTGGVEWAMGNGVGRGLKGVGFDFAKEICEIGGGSHMDGKVGGGLHMGQ